MLDALRRAAFPFENPSLILLSKLPPKGSRLQLKPEEQPARTRCLCVLRLPAFPSQEISAALRALTVGKQGPENGKWDEYRKEG